MRLVSGTSLLLLASLAACGDDDTRSADAAPATTATDGPVGYVITCPDGTAVTASEIAGDFLDDVVDQGRQSEIDVVVASVNEYRVGDRTGTGMLERFVDAAAEVYPDCSLDPVDGEAPSPLLAPIPAGSELRYRVSLVGVTDAPMVERCFTDHDVPAEAITRGDDEWSATFEAADAANDFADCVSGAALIATVSFDAAP